MRKLVLNLLLLAIFGIFINSCSSGDPCKTLICGSNGNCFDGKCFCDLGYEGAKCETKWSDSYNGVWKVKMNYRIIYDTLQPIPPPFSENFNATILAVSATKFSISNFSKVAGMVEFDLKKKDIFEFDILNEAAKTHFKGSGILVNPIKISLNYIQTNFYGLGIKYECIGTMTK
jgi:hypothetical protein